MIQTDGRSAAQLRPEKRTTGFSGPAGAGCLTALQGTGEGREGIRDLQPAAPGGSL